MEQVSRKSGDSVVLCHGHFNIIHPGHIRYLEFARSQGNTLLVTIEGDQVFQESDRKHYFSDSERAAGVASLEIVDQVVLLGDKQLKDAIRSIKPDFLILGKEFEHERYQHIQEAAESLESMGGRILFHAGSSHYASIDLLKESQPEIQKQRNLQFKEVLRKQEISSESLLHCLHDFQKTSLLIIGDSIVDQYVACEALGMSAEAPVIVARELESKRYIGGAGIVALHAQSLGANCRFLSVVGEDENANMLSDQLDHYKVDHFLLTDASRPTTEKIRYMVDKQKLFRLSRLQEHGLSKAVENSLIEEIQRQAPQVHGILISDFVYGVITPRVLDIISQMASRHKLRLFGDLQCSSQVGNVSKFNEFELICPTEREARIALGVHNEGVEWVANTLMQKTASRNIVIKLGSEGFIAYGIESDGFINRQHFPALNPNPVDVAGAGDSLFAALSVGLCSGSTLMQASALGTLMASLTVQTVGNIPVSRQALETSLLRLNFNS